MTIRPITGKGVNRAAAVCDSCGREETVTCDYERQRAGGWIPNEGQIIRKVCAHGWAVVRGRLLCPTCEARRKVATPPKSEEKEEADMALVEAAAAPPHEPDKAMRIDIFVAISSCYDLAAQRYRGDATDRSVAEVVGGGCMPGWVSAVRDAEFGPAGNEEVDALRVEISHAEARLTAIGAALEGQIADAQKAHDDAEKRLRSDLAVLRKRIDQVVAAHDKRVRA